MPRRDAERRPRPESGAQHDTITTESIVDSLINCQALDLLCSVLAICWCDSDTLWRTTALSLAYELTVNLHAAARLVHQLQAEALDALMDCGVQP